MAYILIFLMILSASLAITLYINMLLNKEEEEDFRKYFLEPVSFLNVLAILLSLYVLFK